MQKNSKSLWYSQCLKVPGTTFFEKRFLKVDFLKLVSVTMIANSEERKMKKSHSPYNFCIFSPLPFWFPLQIFWKIVLPTQFFGNFISPLQKRGGRWVGNYVCSSKNLRNNILPYMCVFVGAFWSSLNVFTAVGHIWYGFF